MKLKERPPLKKLIGRPPLKLDWKHIDYLLGCHCSGVEIASNLGIGEETLYHKTVEDKKMSFSDYKRLMQAKGDSLLRQIQFEKATIDKDNSMLIWLGKNNLKQRDKEVEETSDEIKLLREYLAEIRRSNPGLPGACRSEMETQQSLLDQNREGRENQIQIELGARDNCSE